MPISIEAYAKSPNYYNNHCTFSLLFIATNNRTLHCCSIQSEIIGV